MTPEISPDILAQLEQLRDIRLPEPVGWWPLAPGWWIALSVLCAAVLAVMVWSVLHKYTTRYLALRELEQIPDDDPSSFAICVSVLLRRVAIVHDKTAGQLQDAGWAGFLAERGMTREMADQLALSPYAQPSSDNTDVAALRSAAAQWIRRHA